MQVTTFIFSSFPLADLTTVFSVLPTIIVSVTSIIIPILTSLLKSYMREQTHLKRLEVKSSSGKTIIIRYDEKDDNSTKRAAELIKREFSQENP